MTNDSAWDPDWPHTVVKGTITRLRGAVVATIVAAVGWISFTLLYVAFWAHGFSLFQSLVVIFVSLLILFGTLAAVWASFGLRWAHRFD
jgi:hypothetical protein